MDRVFSKCIVAITLKSSNPVIVTVCGIFQLATVKSKRGRVTVACEVLETETLE